jgi:leader peptidase (prepilin peptidase) / N-methyltransferase
LTAVQLLQSSPEAFALLGAVLGLFVGSFLNVVIHRLPEMIRREWLADCAELAQTNPTPSKATSTAPGAGPAPAESAPSSATPADHAPASAAPAVSTRPYNLVVPRSACVSCGHPISALENIPLLSYLALRGRCSACATPIGLRYPLVELLTSALSGLLAWRFGFSVAGAAALLFAWALIALTFIDFDTFYLPDAITQPLLWLGLLLNLGNTFTDSSSALLGAVSGYLTLWTVYWGFKLATKKEGMGRGDFKLLAAIGAWLGWQVLPLVVLLSSLVGAVTGIALMLILRRGRNVPIPFGPYLAASGLIALVWGKPLTALYLHL